MAEPAGSNTGRRPPADAISTTTGCDRWPVGIESSVKPCSNPFGPLTYHSVTDPRRYSARAPSALRSATGGAATAPARPTPRRERARPVPDPVGWTLTPAEENPAARPWAWFVAV